MALAYHQSNIHLRYDAGRALPPDSTCALMESLQHHSADPVKLVVDLGCGTGRFTAALSETFNAQVVGVEPAANMRSAAQAKGHSTSIRFVDGSAENIPLDDGAADLVFMSQVFHHLVDGAAALDEIRRVLRPDGRLCLRQTTRENLDSYFYQQFFPEARAVDEQRLPSRRTLMNSAGSCRYRIVAVQTMRYEIAATTSEYLSKIALRAYSDLESISDEAFRRGLGALRSHADASPDFPKCAENDLFIFCA